MTSARTWKVMLGCSLLFVCYCAVMGYYLLDVNNIQCRIANPIIDTRPAQARFTEHQRDFTSAIQGDELLREDRSFEPLKFVIGELYCGCTRGSTLYVFRSQESAEEVIARFAQDIHVPGWRVQYANAEWVDYRNEQNTTEATITIRSERPGMPTVYDVHFTYAEPNLPNCWEAP